MKNRNWTFVGYFYHRITEKRLRVERITIQISPTNARFFHGRLLGLLVIYSVMQFCIIRQFCIDSYREKITTSDLFA